MVRGPGVSWMSRGSLAPSSGSKLILRDQLDESYGRQETPLPPITSTPPSATLTTPLGVSQIMARNRFQLRLSKNMAPPFCFAILIEKICILARIFIYIWKSQNVIASNICALYRHHIDVSCFQ